MSMAGYTKLFNSILASTIWREDDKTRIVWITLLAMADKNGVAEGSIPGIADFARVSVAACRRALEKLQEPDKESRTGDFDGRRIKPIDGGWLLLNHGKYRARLNQDERREYLRQKQAEYRRKNKPSTNVNKVSDTSTLSTQAEAEAEADTKAERSRSGSGAIAPSWRPPSKKRAVSLYDGREARRHAEHAWCSDRGVCVTRGLHSDFVGRLGTDDADVRLREWYAEVLQRHAGQPIGDDLFAFWRNEFAAWVGTVTTKPTETRESRTLAAARRTSLTRGELP